MGPPGNRKSWGPLSTGEADVRAGAVEWTGRPNGRVTHRLTTTTTHRPESLRARSLSPRLPFTRAPDGGDGLDAARNQVTAPEKPQLR
ncbi:unnamed protein product [Staurois parvus]|uniref:Uncharacterized protein n=1 Tax=Staurois parvus TaxID=386267 RepID=A0ABN9FXH6_9NEOB|nr:unnamed protein product [Staurois parvus]